MGQSAAQPLLDLRDKLTSMADKIESYDGPVDWGRKKATAKSGPRPTAAQLGWAIPAQKKDDDPKLGGAKKKAPAKKKSTAAKKRN